MKLEKSNHKRIKHYDEKLKTYQLNKDKTKLYVNWALIHNHINNAPNLENPIGMDLFTFNIIGEYKPEENLVNDIIRNAHELMIPDLLESIGNPDLTTLNLPPIPPHISPSLIKVGWANYKE